MNYTIRLTPAARTDIRRLYEFLAEKDRAAAGRSVEILSRAFDGLTLFPYSYRMMDPDDPSLRELVIPFGNSGYVAAFRILGHEVTILAIRHQLEDDYS